MPAISQSHFLQALGWALLNSLWQMALLWIFFQILTSLFKLSASKKYSLAILCITAGFGGFVFEFVTAFRVPILHSSILKWSFFFSENTPAAILDRILNTASLIYLFVLALPVGKMIRSLRYVHRIRSKGLVKISAEWRLFVSNTAARMGIKSPVTIWLSERVVSPVTVGFLKPVILLPLAAFSHLTPQQVEAILIHELSHIRRHDYFINLFIQFIRTVLYFNPFVNFFVKIIEQEREMSCDENVMHYHNRPHDYAAALLLLEKSQRQPMLLAAAGQENNLLFRIEKILGIQGKSAFSLKRITLSFLAILTLAFINLFSHPRNSHSVPVFYSLNNLVSPYYFVSSYATPQQKSSAAKAKNGKQSQRILSSLQPEARLHPENSFIPENFQYVTLTTPVLPELPPAEELAIKETIDVTKKILEVKEWNEIEKNIADAFNSEEKVKLKIQFQEEIKKIDWNQLETRLRISYNQINWNKVNELINNSKEEMMRDSLQQELKRSFQLLNQLEHLMTQYQITSVPDTDLTIEKIRENLYQINTQLNKIKSAKARKTIRL